MKGWKKERKNRNDIKFYYVKVDGLSHKKECNKASILTNPYMHISRIEEYIARINKSRATNQ